MKEQRLVPESNQPRWFQVQWTKILLYTAPFDEFLEALQATKSINARGKCIHCLGYLSELWKDLLSGFSKGKFDLCMICYNGESFEVNIIFTCSGKGASCRATWRPDSGLSSPISGLSDADVRQEAETMALSVWRIRVR